MLTYISRYMLSKMLIFLATIASFVPLHLISITEYCIIFIIMKSIVSFGKADRKQIKEGLFSALELPNMAP